MSSPTARTLQMFKKHNMPAGVVERWIPQARKRVDLFGIIDLVALVSGRTVGVQATSGSHVAERIKKAMAQPLLIEWLDCGNRFWVIGWSKQGKVGARKLWVPRIEEVIYNTTDGFSVNNGYVFK